MVVELLLLPFVSVTEWALNLINLGDLQLPGWLGDTLNLVAKGAQFFPIDVYLGCMMVFGFWITLQFGWAKKRGLAS